MEYFIVFPNGTVERVSDDGDTTEQWQAPGLYEALQEAGYPQHRDELSTFDKSFDLVVDQNQVTAHTSGPKPREHPMGQAGEVFLAWRRANVEG